MRASGLTFFFLFVGWSTACGLSVTGSGVADDDGGTTPEREGGTTGPGDVSVTPNDSGSDVADSAPPTDASHDAPVDAPVPNEGGDGCTVLVDDTFTTQSPSWDPLSEAAFGPGQVALTPRGMGARAGAIWWKNALTFSGMLRVEVDYTTDASGTMPGHGVAIGWAATSAPYVIGGTGQSFGLCNGGLDGVAVAADGRDDQLLAMDGIETDCATNGGVFTAVVGGGGKLVMELRTNSLTARFGAVFGTRAVTAPSTGYLGITASTGGPNQAGHVVTSVRVSSCP